MNSMECGIQGGGVEKGKGWWPWMSAEESGICAGSHVTAFDREDRRS